MTTASIVPVKHIFLDVVAYTNRAVEAQCYITTALNRIVKGAINRYHISDDSIIFIPTGDGMCITLLDVSPYDIHVTISKEILRRIFVNNSRVKDDWRKFDVRVGINQGDDNLVMDINAKRNVTGAGINNTRRIMDLADARQILVSSVVYENHHPRQKYYHAYSEGFTHQVKHGLVLKMHQLIQPDAGWLNVNKPSVFAVQSKPEPKLTKLVAYYFAHCIKNRSYIISNRDWGQNNYALVVLHWYLARETIRKSESTVAEPYSQWMPDTEHNTIEELFKLLYDLPYSVCCDLSGFIQFNSIGANFHKYFEDTFECLLVNEDGKQKLKSEWSEICDELELDKGEN